MKGPILKYKPYLSCTECDFLFDLRRMETFKGLSKSKYYCQAYRKTQGYITSYPVTPKWCPFKKKRQLKKEVQMEKKKCEERGPIKPYPKFDLDRKENPYCPYCQEKTIPFCIEYEDGSGWMAGWTCNCEIVKHIEQCVGIAPANKSTGSSKP